MTTNIDRKHSTSISDEHLFPVVGIPSLGSVGEHPVLALFTVTTGAEGDRLGEIVGNVVPFVAVKPGVMARRTWALGGDAVDGVAFFGHQVTPPWQSRQR